MSKLKRILCVEDDPDIRAITKITLEQIGRFEVKMCESGEEAIDESAQFSPDLILIDVMMPGMSGPSTLSRLREVPGFADLLAIFMTARIQPREVEELKSLGAIGVIGKPFDVLRLSDLLNDYWIRYNDN